MLPLHPFEQALSVMTQHIGVISDTHGLLRPQALTALHGASLIIHAGDIGHADVLSALQNIAPVIAIRGNIDKQPWAAKLPDTEIVQVDRCVLYILHNLDDLDLDPPTAGFHAVISGHSHKPKIETIGGVLYFNPGSAGPQRFKLPISVGRLTVLESHVRAEIIEI
jgi:putative phosphoesterase